MYKIIYAHDVHKANLLGSAQLLYRKEREKSEREKKGKKTFSSLKHRKFETGRSASFDHLVKKS